MANAIKWEGAWTSRGNVLTTGLNSLATLTGVVGTTEVNNGTNLDMYGKLEINLEYAVAPAAGAFIKINMMSAPDGTNYEDVDAALDPGNHTIVALIPVILSADAKRYISPTFQLPPSIVKFTFYNGGSQALEASGNTVELFTCNEEVQ